MTIPAPEPPGPPKTVDTIPLLPPEAAEEKAEEKAEEPPPAPPEIDRFTSAPRLRTTKEKLSHGEEQTLQRIKETLVELARESEKRAQRSPTERRNPKRYIVDLLMDFAFLRDDALHEARVINISKGGIGFRTFYPIQPGQVLRAVVRSLDQAEETSRVENFIEIRSVSLCEDGRYAGGGRFIRRIGVDDTNRRKYPRRKASHPLWYYRDGSELLCKGRTLDISQGGLRFQCDEAIPVDEVLKITLRTEPPAFVYADLRGTITVVRSVEKRPHLYELGCCFTQLQVIPLEAPETSVSPSGRLS
ncbi:MAG: PilZ domain-containing protein [Planctomycetota bacterium]